MSSIVSHSNLNGVTAYGAAYRRIHIKNASAGGLAFRFEKTWPVLEKALLSIQSSSPVEDGLEELYKAVEFTCSAGPAESEKLYNALRNSLASHIRSLAIKLNESKCEPIQFLKSVLEMWDRHCTEMEMIQSIFLYLDKVYVTSMVGTIPLRELGLNIFSEEIVADSGNICQQCVDGIMQTIEQERNGATIDRSLIKNLLKMLHDLKLYRHTFEPVFLNRSKEMYEREGNELINVLDISEYLHHIRQRINEEEDRIKYYIDETTGKSVLDLIEQYLITNHLTTILDRGFDKLLDENLLPEIALLYQYVLPIDGAYDKIKTAFGTYVRKQGHEIVIDPEKDSIMVQQLLDFYEKLERIVVECFNKNEKLMHSMKDSFEAFINIRPNKPAELIAKFIDSKLRAGNKELSQDELERILDRTLVLFRFIRGKDVFEAFYKKDLAKRLLVGKSASVDAEKSMLSKLKQECGALFTSKLEGMFKDMEISKDIMIAYNQYIGDKTLPGNMSLNVYVLTLSYWPTSPSTDVILPNDMVKHQENFANFYLSKHSGRKLQWQHSQGQCLLKYYFHDDKKKELQVSLYQTIVLLLFNDADTLSYNEIKARTHIDDDNLKRTLTSLCVRSVRVLIRHSKTDASTVDTKSDSTDSSTMYSLNKNFTHKLYRIKINQIQMKETVEENVATTEHVFQDRQYQVDAAIVRIMKARKKLSHNELLSELFTLLNFPATASDLKKRIESLIERDYIARDTETASSYRYVS